MDSKRLRDGNGRAAAYLALVLCYALCTGCVNKKPITTAVGEPIGEAVSAVIGPAGGELASADGLLVMSVPPGTVAEDTTFSIQTITSLAPTAIGDGYRLEPHGTTFSQPVSLTFSVPEAGVEHTSLGGIGIALQEENGTWRWLNVVSRDETSSTITVQAMHFSDHAVIEGLRISPGQADVDKGKTVQLQVQLCSSGPDDGPLAGLVCECSPLTGFDTSLSNWSVNSVPGGNSTYGTIAESQNGATFTAPSKAPEPNTVRVSVNAQATLLPGEGNTSTEKTVLFSYITIGSPGNYKGSFNVDSKMGSYPWTGKGEATWTPMNPEKDTGEYTITGMLTPDQTEFNFGDTVCVLNESKQKFEGIGEIRKDPLGQYWTIETTQFSATCTDRDGNVTQAPAFLTILWASSCISQGQWAPLEDVNHLTGSYTWNGCVTLPVPTPSATVTWDFVKE
jgi:hypothetical protein